MITPSMCLPSESGGNDREPKRGCTICRVCRIHVELGTKPNRCRFNSSRTSHLVLVQSRLPNETRQIDTSWLTSLYRHSVVLCRHHFSLYEYRNWRLYSYYPTSHYGTVSNRLLLLVMISQVGPNSLSSTLLHATDGSLSIRQAWRTNPSLFALQHCPKLLKYQASCPSNHKNR